MQDLLVIDNVTKSFGSLRAVDGVSLRIARGEAFSLLGPSGCGKTTLLRMLAGFERPDSGRILLKGQDITDLPPERRPVNTVFQNYALFPHLTVWDNIAFGLRMAKKPKAAITAAVDKMIDLVRLQDHARKHPSRLSGGQRQRVAIARALVNEPEVLLLDEPLAALDLKLRQHMLAELTALHREVAATFIYVTHDQGEALSLSHRIAVLNEGRVEQVATPNSLYEAPATSFVASFIGDANFFSGAVHDEVRVAVDGFGDLLLAEPPPEAQAVKLMIRPEHMIVLSGEAPGTAAAVVESCTYFGSHSRLRLRCGPHSIVAAGTAPTGARVWLKVASENIHVLAE